MVIRKKSIYYNIEDEVVGAARSPGFNHTLYQFLREILTAAPADVETVPLEMYYFLYWVK